MDDAQTMILELLDACIRGEAISRDRLAILDRWPGSAPHLVSAVHALHHFADDADIRARDSGHAEYWRTRLQEIRDRLSTGSD